MNQLLRQIYEEQYVEDSEGNKINPFPTSIDYDKTVTLYNIVRKQKPKNTLEIGMAYGISTLSICQALRDNGIGYHVVIDPWERSRYKSIGLLNCEKAGLGNILRFIEEPSYEALPKLLSKGERFDFAFIDGMHLFDYVLVDFFYIDLLLNKGGYIIMDDLWMPAIRKVVAFILRNRSYDLSTMFTVVSDTWIKRVGRIARRIMQNPLSRDYSKQKFSVNKIVVLEKRNDDKRFWSYHRSF